MAKTPSDAEFSTWLTPAAALERLPSGWGFRAKGDAIMTRIQDGSLVALARSVSVQNRGEATKHYAKTAITPDLWCDPFRCRDRAFWTTGDITFDDEPPMDVMIRWDKEPGDDEAHRIITFKDMRIEPGSFAREFAGHLKPAEPEPEPRSERKDTPRIAPTAAEFATWLSPPDALASLDSDWNFETKKNWILKRLATGEVKAATQKGLIHPPMWGQRWHWFGSDFWQTGDLTFFDGPEDRFGRPITGVPCTKIEMHGVRFDPAGFPAKSAPTTLYLPPAPSAEEFEQWWFPCHAVDSFLPLGDDQAREAVRSLLSAGAVRAAAEKLILDDQVLGLSCIPREVWTAVRDERFWSTDFFKIQFGKTSLTAFGVKLDPDAICEHAPPRPPPRLPTPPMSISETMKGLDALAGTDASSAPAPPPETKRLSDGRLTEWAKLFFAAHPRATEKEAQRSLGTMFPNNTVSRARLRAVMPPRQRGRPLKTKQEN
jgi:hypothetical protein